MLPRFFLALIVLFSGVFPGLTEARSAALYTGEVEVDQRLSADQNALIALDQVLMRLTGVTDRSLVSELGLDASVLRLLVSSEQRVRRARLGPDDEPLPEAVHLRIDFDPAGVDGLVARAGLPRLGPERPSILLWLALEDDFGVRLQGSAFLEQEINHHAQRLGLDVIRPLGDLFDLADIDLADIRGGFLDSAEASARRYGAQVIAMLDLRALDMRAQDERDWVARWFWRLEDRDDGRQSESEDLSRLVALGLEGILAALAERFAVSADAEHVAQRRVLVRGIEGEVQYAEVLRHLQSLSAVEQVLVMAARGTEVEFMLQLRSPALEDGLAIGGVLGIEDRRADGSLLLSLLR